MHASSSEASLLSEMLMVKGILPLFARLHSLEGIFSIFLVLWLKSLNSMCSRDLCCLVHHLLEVLTGLYSGCLGRIVTSHTATLRLHFSKVCAIGGRNAHAFSVSIGEVQRAPMIVMAPVLWMLVSFLCTLAVPFSVAPGCFPCRMLHHMSVP